MIRLTVMYNLADDVNEDEFLEWRLGEHQESNMSSPGVIRSDFSRIDGLAIDPLGSGNDSTPPHRFMTTAEWPDMETFRNAFYAPQMQKSIQESMHMLKDPIFLVSEVLVADSNPS
ncbi:MAG: hypothetical protein AAF702_07910 [Chloroflexota bacterium]